MIEHSLAIRLVQTLAHSLWIGALAAVIVWSVCRFVAQTSNTRYALWLAALLIVVVSLPATFFILPGKVDSTINTESLTQQNNLTMSSVTSTQQVENTQLVPEIKSEQAESESLISLANTMAQPPIEEKAAIKFTWAEWLVAGWLLGMIVMCGRLIVLLNRGRNLRRLSSAIDDARVLQIFQQTTERLQLKKIPVIAWSAEITVPAVVGFVRPVVLLPLTVSTGLTSAQLTAMILHELMHLKRRDPWVNLIQLLTELVCFYNPAIWVISRNIRNEREYCCDDAVLQLGEVDAVDYADALVVVAESAQHSKSVPPTILGAALKRVSGLKKRIDRIFGQPAASQPLFSGNLLIAVVVLMIAIVGLVASGDTAPTEPETLATAVDESERSRFLKMLNDSDPFIRQTALNALSEQADTTLVPQAIKMLKDSDSSVRYIAASILHEQANPALVPQLIKMLKDPDVFIRTTAAKALSKLEDNRAVQPLIDVLNAAQDQNELSTTIHALAMIRDERAIDPVAKAILENPTLTVRSIREVTRFDDVRIRDALFAMLSTEDGLDFKYIHMLADMDERRLIPLLLRKLDDPKTRNFRSAVNVLGRLKATEAVEPLLRLLTTITKRDRFSDVPDLTSAIFALSDIGDERAIEPLLDLLQREQNNKILRSLCHALVEFGEQRALPQIEKLRTHKDRRLRNTAEYAVYDIKLGANRARRKSGASKALAMARESLNNADEKLVRAAIRYIARHAEDQRTVNLGPLTQHKNDVIRKAALTALLSDESDQATEILAASIATNDTDHQAAIFALAKRGDKRAFPMLVELTQDSNKYTQRAAAEHLLFFGREANPALCRLLESSDPSTRRAAISSLYKVADESSLDALLVYVAIEERDDAVGRVITALGRINHPRSIAYLKSVLDDPLQQHSLNAARSLVRLGWKPATKEERIRYLVASGKLQDELVPRTQMVDSHTIGEFQMNVPIQTDLSAGTSEYPNMVYIGSIEFRENGNKLTATLRESSNSSPRTTFRLVVRLLDKGGIQIGESQRDIATSGISLFGVILQSGFEPMQLELGSFDTKRIDRFELSLKEVPRKFPVDTTITPPVELKFPSDQRLSLNLSAKRGNHSVLHYDSVTFKKDKPDTRGRPIFSGQVSVNNAGGLNADWRMWMIALDAENNVIGRGSHNLTTKLPEDAESKQESVTVPLKVWGDVSTIKKLRAGVRLTEVRTGVKGNRVTESVSHSIPKSAKPLILDDGTAESRRSIAASGHAVRFHRPASQRYLEAVQIFAARYGTRKPPKADFYVYVLDGNQKLITELTFPYSTIERGDLKWHTLRTPSIELPDDFHIAVAFNPHRTKGVYLGLDDSPSKTSSFTGLPNDGFTALDKSQIWMVRPFIAPKATADLGTRPLADRPAVSTVNPFAGCIEVHSVAGASAGKQSYGGSGPAIDINVQELVPQDVALHSLRLKGIRLYASRYGSGYDPKKTMLDILVTGKGAKTQWSHSFPFSHFGYREKWIDLVIPDAPLISEFLDQGKLTLGLDPHATQFKGVYFHYIKTTGDESGARGIVPGKRYFDVPNRKWMIRVFLAK
ncbi:M56 family metallopeptidase [Gimesia aquarii]|uniref:Regulatory protein BlaR1 n=1 Tax=Gimesia aquarii TaxID=2527964 RepID=A0A517W4L1_9PLAN|nr:M56 family metallopeptidase [Gimesia aquarii]QDU00195.1 Regulatory protein BlaR1 [Gimesia aquarii]